MPQDMIEYGDPCKRCNRPMVPRHADTEPGYVMHDMYGFCHACRVAIDRPVIRRSILNTGDGIIDDVAVERARKGDLAVRVTVDELRLAVHHLRKLGDSEYDIAFVLGMPLGFVRGADGEAVAA